MSEKAKQYIKDYTRNCSNTLSDPTQVSYNPWLTPDHALAVMEITKEDTIEKALSWLQGNINNYIFNDKREDGSDWLKVKSSLFDDLKKYLSNGI